MKRLTETCNGIRTGRTPHLTAASLILALATASFASAAIVINPLDLSDLDANNRPNGWTYRINGTTEVQRVDVDGTYYLRIRRNDTSGVVASLFWDGDAGLAAANPDHLDADGKIKNSFSGSVILRPANSFYGDGPFGVLVGAVSKTHTSVASTNHRGYYIGLIPNTQTGGGGLGIWYNHLTSTSSTAANAVAWNGWTGAALVLQEDYLLEFDIDVANDGISASLFALDVNGDKTGSALRSVSHTAENPLDGYFGLQGGRFGGNRVRDFRDVELSVIPEPGSLALLAASGLIFLARARRLRRH